MYNFNDEEEDDDTPPKEKVEENEQLKEKMKTLRGKMEKMTLKKVQYSQRDTRINHCDRRITLLSDTDISFVLFNISSKFLLYLEYYLLSPKMHKKVNKLIKHSIKYISTTKKSDMSITVIYHGMSLTVLYM